jgi:hypothetical protein
MNTYGYGVPAGIPLITPEAARPADVHSFETAGAGYAGCGHCGTPVCPSYGAANGATGWTVGTKAAVLVALVLLIAYAPKTP